MSGASSFFKDGAGQKKQRSKSPPSLLPLTLKKAGGAQPSAAASKSSLGVAAGSGAPADAGAPAGASSSSGGGGAGDTDSAGSSSVVTTFASKEAAARAVTATYKLQVAAKHTAPQKRPFAHWFEVDSHGKKVKKSEKLHIKQKWLKGDFSDVKAGNTVQENQTIFGRMLGRITGAGNGNGKEAEPAAGGGKGSTTVGLGRGAVGRSCWRRRGESRSGIALQRFGRRYFVGNCGRGARAASWRSAGNGRNAAAALCAEAGR